MMDTDLKQKYRLRVDNCIGTIIEVHKNTRARDENETFLSEFEKLRKAIKDMDMSHISEHDVIMVEQATNALLGEFTVIFDVPEEEPRCTKAVH
ncbi:MAG: hypothetical protein ABII06_04965 [Pseudomonadota bacterium]